MKKSSSGQSSPSMEILESVATKIADTARTIILGSRSKAIQVNRKNDQSLVTSVDVQVEQSARKILNSHFPEHGIVGEETGEINAESDYKWIIDPIDGTEEFTRQIPLYGSIFALHYKGQPVLGIIDHPELDLRYLAVIGKGAYCNGKQIHMEKLSLRARDQYVVAIPAFQDFVRYTDDSAEFAALTKSFQNHRIYRCCFSHTCAVSGKLDAAIEHNVRLWDIAASQILIEEAGGKFVSIRKQIDRCSYELYDVVMGKEEVVCDIIAQTINTTET